MKKNYIAFFALSLATMMPAFAQQLPNPGFEGEWVDFVPWTSKNNTKIQGEVPQGGWDISHTVGTGSVGQTTVGGENEGNGGGSAVRLTNKDTSGNVIPAYLSLGTSWSASQVKGLSAISGTEDGGVFGGIEFAYRPDAVQFDYMRKHGTGSTQPAKVIAYSWTGEAQQAEVPGDNAYSLTSTPKNTTVTMVDRDRNILGIATNRGGAVSGDAALVASLNFSIEGDAAEWTTTSAEFEYASADVPQKMNIIFASFDYFADRSNHVAGDALYVDNVKMLYYSRLAGLAFDEEVVDFNSNKYEYDLTATYPTHTTPQVKLLGASQSAEYTVFADEATRTITVTVFNKQGEDVDGASEHLYTFRFAADEEKGDEGDVTVTPEVSTKYNGGLTIEMLGNTLAEGMDATIEITPEAGDESLCTFSLPNFMIDLGGGLENLGDIVIEHVSKNTTDGVTTYAGEKKGLLLAEGLIEADVTLNGTITDATGACDFKIDVVWQDIPINVTFVSSGTDTAIGGVQNSVSAEAVYYNLQGVRVAQPVKGTYIRKQGGKVSKVYVK